MSLKHLRAEGAEVHVVILYAGGLWEDSEVMTDGGLVSSRMPEAL